MRISRPSARTDPSVSINPAKTFKRVSLSFVRYSFGMCLLFKRLYFRRYFLRGASSTLLHNPATLASLFLLETIEKSYLLFFVIVAPFSCAQFYQ